MGKLEFDVADLRELLVSVYLKAVNSYHDLSELVAEQAISEFIESKKKACTVSLMVGDKNDFSNWKTETSLCPPRQADTSWNTISLHDQFVNTNYSYGDSLPHFGSYNNYSLATTNTITVVSTTDQTT